MHRPLTVAATFAACTLAAVVVTPLAANATPQDATITSPVKDVVLTVGANETSRNLSWLSTDASDRCVKYTPQSGRDHESKGRDREAVVSAYESAAATDAPNEYFHATLPRLKASTTYTYRIGDCKADWSTSYTFTTRDKGAFSFLLFGDPQIGVSASGALTGWPGWQNTLDQAQARFPRTDFLVSAGDQVNSYDNAAQSAEWDLFLKPAQLTQLAMAPTVGNHDNADGLGTQYAEHLAIPNRSVLGATATGTGDYWYTYNGALFMDVNTNNPDLSQHEAFLREAIAANPRATWKTVVFHQAPFSSADHPMDADVMALRENFTPILSKLGINLVLNGHDHDYARSYLMNGTTVEPGTGGSTLKARKGDVLYIATNSASGGKFYPLTGPYPWVAVANQENVANYSRVSVKRDEITVSTYRTTDGSTVDQVTLKK